MIIVNCALRQEDIIDIVETIEFENEKAFNFIKKEGIKLYFESNFSDEKNACSTIKQTIKNSDWGKVLYFNVVEE